MWRWLVDAHRVSGAIVEVVDDHLTVLTMPMSAGLLRRELAPSVAAPLQQTVQASLARAVATSVSLSGYRITSTPISAGGLVAGAVVVAAEEARRSESELAHVGGVLANAMEEELARPAPEHDDGLHRTSAFYELLQAAITSGSDAEVVRTFAEALSVWDDVEVFAYRADIDGRYTLAVSLPGSDLGGAPREVDARPFPIGAGLVRLSARVRDEVGFTLPGDTAVVHLAAEGGPWLIALNAAEDPARAHHAALYVASLGHAMNAALGVETARLTWNIMQQFVDPSSVHEAAARAVRESAARLRAAGGFGVFGPDGSALLLVGRQQDVHPTAPAAMAGRTLRSLIPARPYTAVFEMRALDRVFTRRDIKLFEAAVANFSTWLTSAIGRIAADRERRGRLRSFDEIVDRYVQAAQASKDTASLVLLSSDDQTLSPQGAQALIRLLRPQLRPTDLAGRLTSGDVGILLLRTPGLAAQVVARRLAILLESAAHTLERRLRIGIASQNGDARSATALIENARVHARNTPSSAG